MPFRSRDHKEQSLLSQGIYDRNLPPTVMVKLRRNFPSDCAQCRCPVPVSGPSVWSQCLVPVSSAYILSPRRGTSKPFPGPDATGQIPCENSRTAVKTMTSSEMARLSAPFFFGGVDD